MLYIEKRRKSMKLVIAITGASGTQLGKKFIDFLPSDIEAHIVISDHALTVESFECKEITLHNSDNISASISSGSFQVDATAIIPCSMNTLAKIACGISDNLVTRSAAVLCPSVSSVSSKEPSHSCVCSPNGTSASFPSTAFCVKITGSILFSLPSTLP